MMEIYLDEVNQSLTDEFDQHFKFLEYLASGSFGTVIKAIYLENNKEVAVKVINKGGIDKQKNINRLKQEITILKQLKHKNIVEFHGFIETNQKIYIIMEYIKSGTLKNLIEKRKDKKFNEEEASKIMESLISAVEYLHSREICHRDIKPDNIMFDNHEDLTSLKLVDFGLSAQYFEVLEEYDYCGTLIYMAPEQLEKRIYTKAIDMWSAGIIMYMLLNNGMHPIYVKGDKTKDYIEKLKHTKLKFQNKVSMMAEILIKKLLETNPSQRYTADKAHKHPWITRRVYDSIPQTHLEMWKTRENKKKVIEAVGGMIFLLHFRENFLKNKNKQLITGIAGGNNTITNTNTNGNSNSNGSNLVLHPNNYLYFDNFINMQDYLKKADKQSNLKKANFLKFREKCLEIEITDNNGEANREENDEDAEGKKEEDSLKDKCSSSPLKKNSMDYSPTLKIITKGNMIKSNFKIKLVKDEKMKHLRKKSQNTLNNQNISNHVTQDTSPQGNNKTYKFNEFSSKSPVPHSRMFKEKEKSVSPEKRSPYFSHNAQSSENLSLSPKRKNYLNNNEFRLSLKKTDGLNDKNKNNNEENTTMGKKDKMNQMTSQVTSQIPQGPQQYYKIKPHDSPSKNISHKQVLSFKDFSLNGVSPINNNNLSPREFDGGVKLKTNRDIVKRNRLSNDIVVIKKKINIQDFIINQMQEGTNLIPINQISSTRKNWGRHNSQSPHSDQNVNLVPLILPDINSPYQPKSGYINSNLNQIFTFKQSSRKNGPGNGY